MFYETPSRIFLSITLFVFLGFFCSVILVTGFLPKLKPYLRTEQEDQQEHLSESILFKAHKHCVSAAKCFRHVLHIFRFTLGNLPKTGKPASVFSTILSRITCGSTPSAGHKWNEHILLCNESFCSLIYQHQLRYAQQFVKYFRKAQQVLMRGGRATNS